MNESEDNECKAIQDELHEINKKLGKLDSDIKDQLEQSQESSKYAFFYSLGPTFIAIGIAFLVADYSTWADLVSTWTGRTGLFVFLLGAIATSATFYKLLRRKQ